MPKPLPKEAQMIADAVRAYVPILEANKNSLPKGEKKVTSHREAFLKEIDWNATTVLQQVLIKWHDDFCGADEQILEK